MYEYTDVIVGYDENNQKIEEEYVLFKKRPTITFGDGSSSSTMRRSKAPLRVPLEHEPMLLHWSVK